MLLWRFHAFENIAIQSERVFYSIQSKNFAFDSLKWKKNNQVDERDVWTSSNREAGYSVKKKWIE